MRVDGHAADDTIKFKAFPSGRRAIEPWFLHLTRQRTPLQNFLWRKLENTETLINLTPLTKYSLGK